MNIWLKFRGWFQCRLATDPDPCDEPRGVSGYVRAVAGEPDLDRIIRLQPPCVQRSHCPEIGVRVNAVFSDSRYAPGDHPLVGSPVVLLDDPRFEGRNHVIAEDGVEPVAPIHLQISDPASGFILRRKYSDTMTVPPSNDRDGELFQASFATGININPGTIGEATGVWDLASIWSSRIGQLKADKNAATDEIEIAALSARIDGMANPRNARYFPARMLFRVALEGSGDVQAPGGQLPGNATISPDVPWPLEFWFGAWDADALSGFMEGYLGVPLEERSEQGLASDFAKGLAEVIRDPKQQRR
jgi:hypothetical protein